LRDVPPRRDASQCYTGWVRQTLRHSKGAGRLKIGRDKRGARRKEVMIHRYAREDIGTGYRSVQHRETRSFLKNLYVGIAWYVVLM